MFYTVDFPTRISNTIRATIGNIFIDFCRINSFYRVYHVINGLSDHDAQFIAISSILKPQSNNNRVYKKRLITETNSELHRDIKK
jgi:hypothetical protein